MMRGVSVMLPEELIAKVKSKCAAWRVKNSDFYRVAIHHMAETVEDERAFATLRTALPESSNSEEDTT